MNDIPVMEFGGWDFLMMLWPLWAMIFVVFVIKILFIFLEVEINNWRIRRRFKKGEKWRSDRELIKWLRAMGPTEFEKYTAWLFNNLGYKAKAVGKSHDGGIDVVAEKDGVKHYIQCKKYFKKHSVGVGAVRDFYGAIADRLAEGKAYFITTSKFTLEAEKFAEDKPIELVDSLNLVKYIRLAEKSSGEKSEKSKEKHKSCPKCAGRLIKRKSKYGEFLGCSNYSKCKFTENVK